MGIGVFDDKERQPTMDQVLAAIGAKRPLWESLTQFIADNYQLQGDFMFYGKNYGWSLRFRKGRKALLSMYPGNEGFTVQIVIGQTQQKKLLALVLARM